MIETEACLITAKNGSEIGFVSGWEKTAVFFSETPESVIDQKDGIH